MRDMAIGLQDKHRIVGGHFVKVFNRSIELTLQYGWIK